MLHIKSFIFNPIQENTYVVYNDDGLCAVIDPGCYFEEENEVVENFISQNKLTPIYLLNTHCHLDHVMGNKFIAEKYKLTLHLHKNELPVLEFAPTSGLMYNIPFDNYKGDFIFMSENDVIKLGDDELLVIEAPGHSPGHVCFYNAAQDFLIGGDVLFERSIGRTDLPGGNHQTLINSIQQKLFVLPDQTKVYSGHGNPTTIGNEKQYNPFF